MTPEPSDPPVQRAFPFWPLLSLLVGWGAGAAGFALVLQPIWGASFSDFFAVPPTWVAIGAGLLVGLLAAQITAVGCRERRVPWATLAGALLGMVLGAALGYLLAGALGAAALEGEARFAVFIGMAGALAGGLIARRSKG